MSRFQFVEDHQDTYEVKRLCELVEVARSSYYAWRASRLARGRRAAADAALTERIHLLHRADPTMGAPRITAELNDTAHDTDGPVNRKRVARLMRVAGITGYRRRRRVRATVPDQTSDRCSDLLKRDFTAPAPNRRYVGDIPPLRGRYPLLPASSRRDEPVPGYRHRLLQPTPGRLGTARPHAYASGSRRPRQAAVTRGSLKGAVVHTDHGSVYTSKAFATECKKLGVTQSMGAIGSSADNALAESMGATLKREVLMDARSWDDELTCRRQTFRWLNRYSTVRRHSYCGHLPPTTYEEKQTSTTTLATAA